MASVRYYGLVIFVFAYLAAARVDELKDDVGVKGVWHKAALWISLGFILILTGVQAVGNLHSGALYAAEKYNLMLRLKEMGLSCGYSQYWDASLTTLYAGNDVRLRSIVAAENNVDERKALTAYKWFSKDEWFDEYADFVVVQSEDSRDYFQEQDVLNQFGEPLWRKEVGYYTVMYYGRDLSKELMQL